MMKYLVAITIAWLMINGMQAQSKCTASEEICNLYLK